MRGRAFARARRRASNLELGTGDEGGLNADG